MFGSNKTSNCGIYAIVNKRTGERYVGQSMNISERWATHLENLRTGEATPALQKAWDEYGEDEFEFVVLRTCSRNHLDALEEAYMAEGCEYNRLKNAIFSLGVNLLDGTIEAGPGPAAGFKADDLTEEDLEDLAIDWDAEEEPPDEDAEEWEKLEHENHRKAEEFTDRFNKALDGKSIVASETWDKQERVLVDWIDYEENSGLARARALRDVGMNPIFPGAIHMMLAKLYRRKKDYEAEIAVINRYFALSEEERDGRLAEDFEGRLRKAQQLLDK